MVIVFWMLGILLYLLIGLLTVGFIAQHDMPHWENSDLGFGDWFMPLVFWWLMILLFGLFKITGSIVNLGRKIEKHFDK